MAYSICVALAALAAALAAAEHSATATAAPASTAASAAAAGRAGTSAHVHSGGVRPELEAELEADSLGAVPMASSLSPTWLG